MEAWTFPTGKMPNNRHRFLGHNYRLGEVRKDFVKKIVFYLLVLSDKLWLVAILKGIIWKYNRLESKGQWI